MTEQQHDQWINQVTRAWPETKAAAHSNIADGFWWTDIKTGERKWQTGDMLREHVRNVARAEVKQQQISVEEFALALGKKFRQERERHNAEIEALKAEIEILRKQVPPRLIAGKGKDAA